MPYPTQAPGRTSLLKDMLVIVLSLTVVALMILLWRQQAEIRHFAAMRWRGANDTAPAMIVHAATSRNLELPPARTAPRLLADLQEMAAKVEAREPGPRPAGGDGLSLLLDNPEFRRALELHREASLDARFAGLFRRLELTAEELAAFKHLLAEKENVALDVVAVSDTLPGGPLPAETLSTGVTAARTQVEDAIRNSLGNERYAVYREYEQTLPQRAVVAQLEQRLSYSAAPLSPAQSESLVKILVTHAPAPAADTVPAAAAVVVGAGTTATGPLVSASTAAARVTEAALTESQSVLAPAQVAALRSIQTEQIATQRALQLIEANLPPSNERSLNAGLRVLLQ